MIKKLYIIIAMIFVLTSCGNNTNKDTTSEITTEETGKSG